MIILYILLHLPLPHTAPTQQAVVEQDLNSAVSPIPVQGKVR